MGSWITSSCAVTAPATWVLYELVYSAGWLTQFYRDGLLLTSTSGYWQGMNGVTFNTGPAVGAGEASDFLLAELLVYQRAVGNEERQRIEGYLMHKHGLQSQLPTGHPFYAAPLFQPSASASITSTVSPTASWSTGASPTVTPTVVPVPWDPSQLTSVDVWLRPEELPQSSGAEVARWANAAPPGRDYDATPQFGRPPVVSSESLNGKRVVRFTSPGTSGAGTSLTSPLTYRGFDKPAGGFTIVLLYRFVTGARWERVLGQGWPAGSDWIWPTNAGAQDSFYNQNAGWIAGSSGGSGSGQTPWAFKILAVDGQARTASSYSSGSPLWVVTYDMAWAQPLWFRLGGGWQTLNTAGGNNVSWPSASRVLRFIIGLLAGAPTVARAEKIH